MGEPNARRRHLENERHESFFLGHCSCGQHNRRIVELVRERFIVRLLKSTYAGSAKMSQIKLTNPFVINAPVVLGSSGLKWSLLLT